VPDFAGEKTSTGAEVMTDQKVAEASELARLTNRLNKLAAETERLRAENAYLTRLYQKAPMGYQSLDQNGLILEVNQAWLDSLGYQRDEVIGVHFSTFLHPDWRSHFLENFPKFKAVGEILGVEFEMVKKDGSWLMVSFHGKIGYDEENRFLQTHCIFQDITGRRQAEETLRENITRTRSQRDAIARIVLDPLFVSGNLDEAFDALTEEAVRAMQVSQASIWLFSEDGLRLECLSLFVEGKEEHRRGAVRNIADVPRYIAALRGEGRIVAEAVESDLAIAELADNVSARQRITALIDTAILVKGRVVGVVSFAHVGGKRHWYPDEEAFAATIAAMAAQAIANSEREQLLVTLRGSEKQYRELFDNAPLGIFQISEAGSFLSANPEYARLAGYADPPDLLSRVTDIAGQLYVYPEERERYQAYLRRHGQAKNYQVELKRPDGERFWASMNTRVRKDLFHGVVYDGFLMDITEHKRIEAEQEKIQAQLTQAQKMESIGRLAGGVAHDFNNMLGVILGYSEMALEQIPDDRQLQTALRGIQQAAERSADLTRQLLAFARKQTVAPKVLDLNQTLETMLSMLRRLIGEHIDLAWLPGDNLPPLKIDPSQIDQILANLFVKARDASGAGGTVTIETGTALFDEEYCAAHADTQPGSYLLLAVSDDGCGMDPETVNHIFEPFFTTKKIGEGTGLGLATVYGIVRQNNGVINVYSELGHGTTFKIYLPAYGAEVRSVGQGRAVLPNPTGSETILLVEDEPMILEMTKAMLSRQGYHVLTAASPGEAIRLAGEHRGDIRLLMTDVVMPEMNGRDLAKNLLSLYPDLLRLFMSGYTANVIAHHGVLDDGVHFIQKPFTTRDLAAKIREVLDTRLA
jgi:PAS domain S-box-containing protein